MTIEELLNKYEDNVYDDSVKQQILSAFDGMKKDLANAVDREMELNKQIAELKAENEKLKICRDHWKTSYDNLRTKIGFPSESIDNVPS